MRGARRARSRGGRRGDPQRAEDAAGAARRLPHARCARRRALCRQGARAEEPRGQLHPGRRGCRSGCSGWSRRRASMTIVTTNNEAEALLLEAQLIKRFRPPYNVLLRDDKSFPFILLRADHDFPRIQKHRGARARQGQLLRPVRQRRLGQQHAQRAAEAVPAAQLHRQLLRDRATGRACSTRSSAARRRASGGSTRRTMPSWSATRRTSSAASRPRCRRSSARRWQAAAEAMDFELRRDAARPAARADLHPGQPGDQRRGRGRRRHLRAGLQGRA